MSSSSPSIRDVAEAAGVSVATASRVMAKADYPVAEQTRLRVLEAARQLNFTPNVLARDLARARTDSIGVVVPGIMNQYYAGMVEAIDAAARAEGLTAVLGLTGGDETRREQIVDEFVGRRVDGIIVCAGADDHVPGRSSDTLGVPAVLVGDQPDQGSPIIKTNNHRAGYRAAEYLWSLGHRSFAYLTGLDTWHDFRVRGQGIAEFLEGTGEPYELTVHDGLANEHDAYRRVQELGVDGLRATAVIASTDRHALGAMAALSDAGVQVPSQVSVMGFDDYVTSAFLRPALTTMQMPSAAMGRLAVEFLAELIRGRSVTKSSLMDAVLVERGSTGYAMAGVSPATPRQA